MEMKTVAVTLMCVIVASAVPLKEREKKMKFEPLSDGRHSFGENCLMNIDHCDHLAWDKGTLTGEDCSGLISALSCLRDIPECVSDLVFRTRYLLAQEVVSPWNDSLCPQKLESTFYNDSLGPCEMAYQTCLFHYTGVLVTRLTVLDVNVLCQDLNNFINCQVYASIGCPREQRVTKASMRSLVDLEIKRMHVEDCQVPGLEPDNCEQSAQNCLHFAGKSSENVRCSLTEEAMKCLVGLKCHSRVQLRMFELSLRDGLPSSCKILPEFTPQDCVSPMSACLHQYLDTLVEEGSMKDKVIWIRTAFNFAAREVMPRLVHVTEREKLCRGLKAYSVCLHGITTCQVDVHEVESMISEEETRLKSYSCSRSKVNARVYAHGTAQKMLMPWWLRIGLSVAWFIEIVILPIFHLVHIE